MTDKPRPDDERDAEELARLYRAYQTTRESVPSQAEIMAFARRAMQQRAAGEAVTRAQAQPEQDAELTPDELYKLYQAQRDVPGPAATEAVLQKAREKLDEVAARQGQTDAAQEPAPGMISKIFDAPAKALSALGAWLSGGEHARSRWQVLVPVAAAALLLLAIVPAVKLFQAPSELTSSQVAALFPFDATQQLLGDASNAVAFVETGSDTGFGFTQSASKANSAFQYGVLTVAGAVAGQARDKARLLQLAQRLIQVSERTQQPELTRALAAAIAEDGDADTLAQSVYAVSKQLNSRFAGDPTYQPYYQLGQWAETADIAARFSQARADSSLLRDALTALAPLQAKLAASAELDPALAAQLTALSQVDAQAALTPQQLRAIAKSIQQLKYSML